VAFSKSPRNRSNAASPLRSSVVSIIRAASCEDEVAVLSESICDDLDSIGFSPIPNSGERGEQNLAVLTTNRELVGVILSGGGPATFRASRVFLPSSLPTLPERYERISAASAPVDFGDAAMGWPSASRGICSEVARLQERDPPESRFPFG
jgi:hypothetical protein